MAATSRQKSTTGRIKLIRWGFRLGDRLAPAKAARIATRLWFRLPYHRSSITPAGAAEFHLSTPDGEVWGYEWGDGPLVYLLHGWGGSSADFANLATSLVASGHRVVAVDAPSHGRSGPSPFGPGSASPRHFAQALTAANHKFGTGAIVAHSMGCLATAIALREEVRADRVVLIAPFIGGAAFVRRFADELNIGARTRPGFLTGIEARSGRPLSYFDVTTPPIEVPTLIVHDRLDRQTPFHHGQAIADAWPQSTLEATEGMGHLRIARNPTVIGVIRRFLSTAEGTS